jgi:hypothetical protein
VTGRQFFNDFNVSWNVFSAVTDYKGGKSSNRLRCPYPNSPSRNLAGAAARADQWDRGENCCRRQEVLGG